MDRLRPIISPEGLGEGGPPAEPDPEEWRNLCEAALEVKELAPWEWMPDSDFFAVRDPETNRTLTIGVLGALGDHLAVAAYPGPAGFASFLNISGLKSPGDEDWLEIGLLQDCFSASFEDRNELGARDRDLLKRFGIRCRGRRAWPLFRRHLPGAVPRFLDPWETRALTHCLRQTAEVAGRLKEDPKSLRPKRGGKILVRVPRTGKDGLEWSDAWEVPKAELPKREPPEMPDLHELQRMLEQANRVTEPVEMDFFPLPTAVRDDAGPYYPWMLLWVLRSQGLILGMSLSRYETHPQTFLDDFLAQISAEGFLPLDLRVRRARIAEWFGPLIEGAGGRIELEDELEVMSNIRAKMERTGLFGLNL